jgi:hypothetical protein
VLAGPPDFGQQELRAAIAERRLPLTIDTELNLNQPETFVATPIGSASIRVSGGDLRGLMYGLLDTADQVRSGGSVVRKAGEPGFHTRSVRIAPSDAELMTSEFYNTNRWIKTFEMLARNRVNRITVVMPVEHLEYDRVRFLTRLGSDYAVDFNLGLRAVEGGQVTRAQIRKVLDECVLIRGIQLEVGREPVDYFKTAIFPAVQQTGRRVTLDLRGAEMRPDIVRAGHSAGVVFLIEARNSTASLDEPFYRRIAVASTSEPSDVASVLNGLADTQAAGFELDLSGSNLENYERIYWAWGRAGYDHRSPGLAPGKPDPPPAPKAKAPAKSTTKKK